MHRLRHQSGAILAAILLPLLFFCLCSPFHYLHVIASFTYTLSTANGVDLLFSARSFPANVTIVDASTHSTPMDGDGWTGRMEVDVNGQLILQPNLTAPWDPLFLPGQSLNITSTPQPQRSFIESLPLASPPPYTLSVPPASTDTHDLLLRISPSGLMQLFSFKQQPLSRYIGRTIACSSTLPFILFKDRAVECMSIQSLVAGSSSPFHVQVNTTTSLRSNNDGDLLPFGMLVTVTGVTDEGTNLQSEVLSLLFHLFHSQVAANGVSQAISSSNVYRRDQSRVAVGFLWAFAGLVMLFVLVLAATFQSWLYPLFPLPWALPMWVVILVGVTIVVSITTGINGFLILLILFLAHAAAIGSYYYIMRLRNRETPELDQENSIDHEHCQAHALNRGHVHGSMSIRKKAASISDANDDDDDAAAAIAHAATSGICDVGETDGSSHVQMTHPNEQQQQHQQQQLTVPPEALHVHDASTSPQVEAGHPSSTSLPPSHHSRTFSDSGHASSLVDSIMRHNQRTDLESGLREASLQAEEDDAIKRSMTTRPDRLGQVQRKSLCWNFGLFLGAFVLCVALFGLWRVEDYKVVNRQESFMTPSHGSMVEYVPQTLAKGVLALYAFDGYASKLHMDSTFFQLGTEWCGNHFSQHLETDEDRYQAIQVEYVLKYGIDMSVFIPDTYTGYSSVNDWFSRAINPLYRPIDPDTHSIVSPAEGRVTAWTNNPFGVRFYIKGHTFTMDKFLTTQLTVIDPLEFDGGSMVVVRLAPQDYHRLHAPVRAKLLQLLHVDGSLHSVNMDAITSKNDAILNKRVVMIFDSEHLGKFAYVAVGALCVGSVLIEPPASQPEGPAVGATYEKGETIGTFQFGGSTAVLVFRPGTVRLDDDLLFHSANKVESFVEVNSRIGVATNQAAT